MFFGCDVTVIILLTRTKSYAAPENSGGAKVDRGALASKGPSALHLGLLPLPRKQQSSSERPECPVISRLLLTTQEAGGAVAQSL